MTHRGLLGFLALELLGFRPDLALEELANVGVMLLLFTLSRVGESYITTDLQIRHSSALSPLPSPAKVF